MIVASMRSLATTCQLMMGVAWLLAACGASAAEEPPNPRLQPLSDEELVRLQATVREQTEALAVRDADAAALRRQLADRQTETAATRRAIASVQTKLDELREVHDALREERTALRQELEGTRATLTEELARLQTALEELRRSHEAYREARQDAQQRLEAETVRMESREATPPAVLVSARERAIAMEIELLRLSALRRSTPP